VRENEMQKNGFQLNEIQKEDINIGIKTYVTEPAVPRLVNSLKHSR
jgi:hypothetical protein